MADTLVYTKQSSRQDLEWQWRRLESLRKAFERATSRLPVIFSEDNVAIFLERTLDPPYAECNWKPSSDRQLIERLWRLGVTGHRPDLNPVEYVEGALSTDLSEGGYIDSWHARVHFWRLDVERMLDFAKTCRFQTVLALGLQFVAKSGGYTLWSLLKQDWYMREELVGMEESYERWFQALEEFLAKLIDLERNVASPSMSSLLDFSDVLGSPATYTYSSSSNTSLSSPAISASMSWDTSSVADEASCLPVASSISAFPRQEYGSNVVAEVVPIVVKI